MKYLRNGLILGVVVSVLGLLVIEQAHAQTYRNDLNLSKLHGHYVPAGLSGPALFDARQNANLGFRNLMSQLGMALAPQFHSPAETTGYNGFAFVAKYGATTIDDTAEYWEYGLDRAPDPVLHTLAMEIRKGIWFPIPSFELGAGFTHLLGSHLFSLNASAKLALHEGFLHWATPALAVRFTGQRVVGTSQVDLTIIGVDVSMSKSFGVGGTFNFTPYLGYNALWIFADSQVIDTTPNIDSLQCSADPGGCSVTTPIVPGQFCTDSDCGSNYVFDDQDAILRHRVFLGLRIIYYRLSLTFEASWSLPGNSKDEILQFDPDSSQWVTGQLKDKSKFQQTYSVSLGWDY